MIETVYDPIDGLVKLGLALILLVIAIAISWAKNLKLEKEIGIAAFRAIVQLMIVVLIIAAVFRSESLILMVLVLFGMTVFAAFTSAKRAKEISDPLRVTFPSIAMGSAISLLVLLLLGVLPLQPEFLIPVGSMTIGGCMVVCSLVIDRLMGEISNSRALIETSLCLGATDQEALEPLSRKSMKASLIPSIDRLETLGTVILPGTMAGMIIAGVDPIWAAEYQLIIMFLLLASGMITAVLAMYLALKSIKSIGPLQS